MEELKIFGWIFLVIFVLVGLPAILQASILVENDRKREMQYKELTTISEEESNIIRQILNQYKWKKMFSPIYEQYVIADSIDVNVETIATNLAVKYAQEFAVLNGYNEKIITKLYYMYNVSHGKLCIDSMSYSIEDVPAKRDILTGQITEGYTYTTDNEVAYRIQFFVLENKT